MTEKRRIKSKMESDAFLCIHPDVSILSFIQNVEHRFDLVSG
jgi:hypothetical protein